MPSIDALDTLPVRRRTAAEHVAYLKHHRDAVLHRRRLGLTALPMSRDAGLEAIAAFVAINGMRRFVHAGGGEWRVETVRG